MWDFPRRKRADRALRARCARLLSEFALEAPIELEALTERLAACRDRPLHIHPMPEDMRREACGVWIATDRGDWIFYDPVASPPHRLHIVLHEIGHMLFDHDGGVARVVLRTQTPDSNLIRRFASRGRYEDRSEREAEMFARVAGERLGLDRDPPGRPDRADSHFAARLDRLAATLERPKIEEDDGCTSCTPP